MHGVVDEYAAARGTLLDALDALEPQREAFVLVGAQAVYLRLGEADIAIPAFTTDGDLAIDPSLLRDEPVIPEAMQAADFRLHEERPGVKEPGIWELSAGGPTVDLLVPRSLRPIGRRGARLGAHGNQAAKTVPGLEGALIDRDRMIIRALDPGDRRELRLWVAGPAALLVMKLYKIAEHLDEGRPVEDKDAHDVLRLLRDVPVAELTARYRRVLSHPSSRDSAVRGVELLGRLRRTHVRRIHDGSDCGGGACRSNRRRTGLRHADTGTAGRSSARLTSAIRGVGGPANALRGQSQPQKMAVGSRSTSASSGPTSSYGSV